MFSELERYNTVYQFKSKKLNVIEGTKTFYLVSDVKNRFQSQEFEQ